MLNFSDLRLVPLSDLIGSVVQRNSYIEMLAALYEDFDQADREVGLGEYNGRYTLASVFDHYELDNIRKNFDGYVQFMRNNPPSSQLTNYFVMLAGSDQVIGQSLFQTTKIFTRVKGFCVAAAGNDVVSPEMRNQGFGKAILALRIAKAKEMGADVLLARVDSRNEPSLRRLTKLMNCGLAYRRLLRRSEFIIPTHHQPQELFDAMQQEL